MKILLTVGAIVAITSSSRRYVSNSSGKSPISCSNRFVNFSSNSVTEEFPERKLGVRAVAIIVSLMFLISRSRVIPKVNI